MYVQFFVTALLSEGTVQSHSGGVGVVVSCLFLVVYNEEVTF